MTDNVGRVIKTDNVIRTSSGIMKLGNPEDHHPDSKFPEGYFNWLDKRVKYDRLGGTMVDYDVTKDIKEIKQEAMSHSAQIHELNKQFKKLNRTLTVLVKLLEERVKEDEQN